MQGMTGDGAKLEGLITRVCALALLDPTVLSYQHQTHILVFLIRTFMSLVSVSACLSVCLSVCLFVFVHSHVVLGG